MKKNISVLGSGYWGQNLIRNYYELGALKYIYDNDSNLNKSFNEKYNLETKNLDQILRDSDIEGVVISTPAETHYEICKLCFKHDKHVFVEKPITLNIAEAEDLISLSKEKNKILMVGHLLQYHSHFIKFKELISQKKESPKRIVSIRKSLGKIRNNENVLWSFAPHDLSMINSLVKGEIKNLKKITKSYFNNNHDAISVNFQKGSQETIIDLEVDWTEIEKIQRISAYFSDEIIVFEDSQSDSSKKLYKLNIPFTKNQLMSKSTSEKIFINVESNNPLYSECKHFLDCIRYSNNPITDGKEALEVLKDLIILDES